MILMPPWTYIALAEHWRTAPPMDTERMRNGRAMLALDFHDLTERNLAEYIAWLQWADAYRVMDCSYEFKIEDRCLHQMPEYMERRFEHRHYVVSLYTRDRNAGFGHGYRGPQAIAMWDGTWHSCPNEDKASIYIHMHNVFEAPRMFRPTERMMRELE